MEVYTILCTFCVSLLGAYVIVKYPSVFVAAGGRHVTAKQSAWRFETPRSGGIAIMLSVSLASYITENQTAIVILMSALPLLLAGLVEDTTKYEISPKYRLLIAALCSAIASAWFGVTIERVDVAYLDPMLQMAAVGFVFTMFAVAGFTHALNLVDGLNGFSSFIAITIMIAFGYLAFHYGHADLLAMNVFVAVAFLGFMVFNFPKGRIFLGDAGAYCFGFVIAWNAVLLLNREPDISAWAILSILFWPVADTLWAMLRRLLNNMPVGKPDRLHFHSVMQRTLIIRSRNKMNLERANPIASLILWPVVLVPVLSGVLLVEQKQGSLIAAVVMAVLFVLSYSLIIRTSTRNGSGGKHRVAA